LSAPWAADLDLAHALADTADEVATRYFGSADLKWTTKSDGSPVTVADQMVEAAVRELLRRHRPHDAIVGEEAGGEGDGNRVWYIDPIDGTAGYLAGTPYWRTLLALEVDGAVQVGLASSPALGRGWWATRGGGAWTRADRGAGPEPLAVSRAEHLDRAGIASWPALDLVPEQLRAAMARLATRSQPAPPPDPSDTPHGALLVATGRADAFVLVGAGPWDLAPMVVIVEEAGGRFSDGDGGRSLHDRVAVFSNGALHEQILDCLDGAASPLS
jgi:histidinol-phosphatase